MILYTFLETYDLSGKTIIPSNTHGGSEFSDTISTIDGLQPNARALMNGFTVSINRVGYAEPNIEEWRAKLGHKK